MSSGGSSNPSGSTTTVQKSDPWSGAVPYLTGGQLPGVTNPDGSNAVAPYTAPGTLNTAQQLASSGGPQYYPGQTYATPTGYQNQAITDQANVASQGSPLYGSAVGASQNILGPNFLNSNPGSALQYGTAATNANNSNPANATLSAFANGSQTNPFLDDMAARVKAQVEPGLTNQFTAGNRMGSPGSAYAVSSGLGDALTQMYGQYLLPEQQLQENAASTLGSNYLTGQGLSTAAAQNIGTNYGQQVGEQNSNLLTAPSTQQMPYTDISNLYNAGATQQTQDQASINDAITRYNYGQSQPYNLLDWLQGMVSGVPGGTSSLTTPYFSQASGGGLGGALSGGASGAMMGGSMAGPYGAIGGGILGALAGGFSK